MPSRGPRAARITIAVLLTAGCTTPSASRVFLQADTTDLSGDAQFAHLASDMATDIPDTTLLSALPGTCGPATAPVVHLVLPEQVLFATASDRPGPDATAALNDIAHLVAQDAPAAELTVLGHTDSVGSDAYNMDLSKRRAVTVLRALVARGLDPARLSAVAIGKRQPIADNSTPAGRARNRRVEFLVSRCLAANLGVVASAPRPRALLAPDGEPNRPVDVMRLDPAGAFGLARLATISLRAPEGSQPLPAAALPPPGVARAIPAPHYQPRTPAPDAQPNPLGPAVPF